MINKPMDTYLRQYDNACGLFCLLSFYKNGNARKEQKNREIFGETVNRIVSDYDGTEFAFVKATEWALKECEKILKVDGKHGK
jgi:hypothetical protein